MRIAVTGATGLIGTRLVRALTARGNEIVVLSRDPERALRRLEPATARAVGAAPSGGSTLPPGVAASGGDLQAVAWSPANERAPSSGLAGSDAVVHLAGESIAQRWTARAKREIRASRIEGTRNLVRGIAALPEARRPRTLVSSSAIGYYGARGNEPIDEEAPAGEDFLAQTCAAWEAEAETASGIGLRVVRVRTGVVLDPAGGALGKMLPPFKLGVGGPVAGGRQYISWIHIDDLLAIFLACLDDERWRGAVNATAPEPSRNRDFSKALGHTLCRPALLPVPGLALRLMYGEMSEIVTTGARVLPAQALMNGYEFVYPELEEALRAALAGST